ncbi:MAG: XRE family transcriptional regulator [Candidatus Omnitrophica bacterium]|nr:XRE family transcriptional regulator [Candidatus Omnitrophota bacterium]
MKKKIKKSLHDGNIFKDLALPHPNRLIARAKVMLCVAEIIRKRGLTQKAASEILGIPQSKVSCLMNGKLSMFSLDHLFEILRALDRNVEIVIRPRDGGSNATHISLAA